MHHRWYVLKRFVLIVDFQEEGSCCPGCLGWNLPHCSLFSAFSQMLRTALAIAALGALGGPGTKYFKGYDEFLCCKTDKCEVGKSLGEKKCLCSDPSTSTPLADLQLCVGKEVCTKDDTDDSFKCVAPPANSADALPECDLVYATGVECKCRPQKKVNGQTTLQDWVACPADSTCANAFSSPAAREAACDSNAGLTCGTQFLKA